MTSKPPKNDADVFRKAVKGVKQLHSDKHHHSHVKAPPKARFTKADQAEVLKDSLAGTPAEAEFPSGDELRFQQPGVQQTTMRKLRRGQFSVQAELDLHGLISEQAHDALIAFIDECTSRNMLCVRVIHGKGKGSGERGPVLKQKTAGWLRRHRDVQAFCAARPVDGGTGAAYVLLKRKHA